MYVLCIYTQAYHIFINIQHICIYNITSAELHNLSTSEKCKREDSHSLVSLSITVNHCEQLTTDSPHLKIVYIVLPIIYLPFFLSLFIYFERDRDSASGGGAERGRERKSQAGFMPPAQNPMGGLELTKQ